MVHVVRLTLCGSTDPSYNYALGRRHEGARFRSSSPPARTGRPTLSKIMLPTLASEVFACIDDAYALQGRTRRSYVSPALYIRKSLKSDLKYCPNPERVERILRG